MDPGAAPNDVGLFRPVLAVAVLTSMALLFWRSSDLRHLEAAMSALTARTCGIGDARVAGSSVVFRAPGGMTGYGISLGCSVAFLLVPFSAVTTVLLVIRRVAVGRSLVSLLAAALTIVACNQLRLLTIGAAMAEWGPAVGYQRTHLLVGTMISTAGVVTGGTVYLSVLLRGSTNQARNLHE